MNILQRVICFSAIFWASVGNIIPERHRVTTDTTERYRAPALDKGLDILELLAEQSKGMTRAEIVKAMGRGPSEIYRMLERLVIRGYVERVEGGDRYALSMKMFVLSTRHPAWRRLVASAQPMMDEFTRATLQSCHLVVPDRGNITVIAQASPVDTWEFRVRLGSELSVLESGSGRTLLAFQALDELPQTLALWGLSERAEEALEIHQQQEPIRQQGYREMTSSQLSNVTDISVPVLGVGPSAIAVLTCPYIQRSDTGPTSTLAASREALSNVAAKLTEAWA